MSETWKSAWVDTMVYWRDHWREWVAIYLVSVIGFSTFLVMNPALAPFVFTQIQPINDVAVLKTFHQNVGALMGTADATLVSGVVILAISIGVLSPLLLRKGLTLIQAVTGIVGAAAVTVAAMAVLAVASAPKGAETAMLAMGTLGIVAVGMVVIVPTLFWMWPLAQNVYGMSVGALVRRHLIDAVVMVWAWVMGIVMSGMLAAAFGWALPVIVGDVTFAIMTVATTITAYLATHKYLRTIPDNVQHHPVQVQFKNSLHS